MISMKKEECKRRYVLLTAARNEEKNIARTIESVLNQTIRPVKWIIVSDGSTDNTDEIIKKYENKYSFIEMFRVAGDERHNFGSKVKALNAARPMVRSVECDYIGVLDADVSFEPEYFEQLIERFEQNPKLGLGGGIIYEIFKDKEIMQNVSLNSVAGATQFFRKICFQLAGDFIPLTYGGEDAANEIFVKMNSWEVMTFPELRVLHYGYVGKGSGNPFRARYRRGLCFFHLGYHPLFEILRCIFILKDRPFIIGSIVELAGFFLCYLRGEKAAIPPEAVEFLRKEQMGRLKFTKNIKSISRR